MLDEDGKSGPINAALPEVEQALHLKALAEQCYNSGDLNSAMENANRAHELCPSVGGLSELLTNLRILDAAGGGDKATPDYYAILQVERFSHINLIKKQYKRLALTLHPDKNPHVASEAAFKLVGEAARVLSDNTRRKEYDLKLRVSMQSEANQEAELETFLSSCSSCGVLNQLERKYLGQNLVCSKCKESYKAVEVGEGGNEIGEEGEGVGGGQTRVSARIKEKVAKGEHVGIVERLGLGVKRKGRKSRDGDGDGGDMSSKDELKSKRVVRGSKNGGGEGSKRIDESEESMTLLQMEKARKLSDGGGGGDLSNKDELGLKGVGRGSMDSEEEGMTLFQMKMLVKPKTKMRKVTEVEDVEIEKEKESVIGQEVEGEREDDGKEKEKGNSRGKRNRKAVLKDKKSGAVNDVEDVGIEEEKESVGEQEVEGEDDGKEKGKANLRGKRNRKAVSKAKKSGAVNDVEDVGMEEEKESVGEQEVEREEGEKEKEKVNLRGKRNRKGVSINKKSGAVNDVEDVGMEGEKESVGEQEVEKEEGGKEKEKEKVSSRGKRNRKGVSKDKNLGAVNDVEDAGIEKEKESVIEQEVEGEDEGKMNLRGKRNRKGVSKDKKSGAVNDVGDAGIEKEKESVIEQEVEGEDEGQMNLRGKRNRKGVSKDKKLGAVNDVHLEIVKCKSSQKGDSEDGIEKEKEKEKGIGSTIGKRERRRTSKYGFSETNVDSEIESLISDESGNLEIMPLKDNDFHDFGKDRKEKCFKKGQVWAVYDDDDRMPKHYGLIDRVVSVNPFKVTFIWLRFQSNKDEELLSWPDTGFPVSCGIFQLSRKVTMKYLNIFSHIVDCERAAKELYRIYPKKGSVWAMHNEGEKDNDKDTRCYDIVVCLTSYSDIHGLSVGYLEKVPEFKTVYKRRAVGAKAVICLKPKDVRKLLHEIPAKKLSGKESPNLPKGCWELDPAALAPQSITAS